MSVSQTGSSEAAAPSKGDILVVDDEAFVRQAIVQALRRQGYHTAAAADGREALAQLGVSPPDVIICDIAMPNLDGIELCRIVRLDPGLAGVPFLFLSAYQDIEARLHGLAAGADDFLGKPFSLDELVYRVNRLLVNRRAALVDDSVEVNPNHLGQVSFEQALDLIAGQSLSGLLSVILKDGAIGRAAFEDGRLTEVFLEGVNGEVVAEGRAALEAILAGPRTAFTFSGQQTLDDAVLMSRITRIVESEAGF